MRRRLLFTPALLLLSACGFQPMYGTAGSGEALQAELSNVSIDPIPSRLGQLVYQDLRELTGNDRADGEYRLEVDLTLTDEGRGFRADEVATRINLMLTAVYQLRDVGTDRVLLDDQAQVFSAYDVVESDFATLTARQDTERNLAERLARSIHTRLAAYFRKEDATGRDEASSEEH